MARSLKYGTTLIVALSLALIWLPELIENHAFAQHGRSSRSSGSRSSGSRSSGSRSGGGHSSGGRSGGSSFGGSHSGGSIFGGGSYGEGHSGPSAGQIIGGIIGLGNAIHNSQQPHYPTHPVYPTPVYPIQPTPNYVYPQPRPQPQPTPAAPVQPNKIDAPAEVQKNDGLVLVGRPLTPEVLAAWKNQTKDQSDKVLAEIGALIPQAAAEALAALTDVTDKAASGALAVPDLQALALKMKPGMAPGMGRRANRMFNRLAVLSRLMALLNTAVPGGGPVPLGNQVPMALVPGLPRGTIIVLGNGAVIIGVGNLRQVVAVGRGNVAQACGMTVAVGAPLPETDAKFVSSGAVLINAEDVAVNYNVNNNAYSMEPEFRQPLPGGRTWTVAFDKGGSFGQARYGISKGTYKFTLTDEGWNLFKHTFDVTIDNSENPFDFLFVLDNKNRTLPAGQTLQHSSDYPPVVRFDDAQGKTKTKRVESGLYKVAVTPEQTLDLYDGDAVAPPQIASAATAPSSTPTAPAPGTASSDGEAPFTSTAGLTPGASLFGDQGDWSPSLFVNDVPEVPYFEET